MSENMLNVFMGFLAGFNLALIVCVIAVFLKVRGTLLGMNPSKVELEKLLPSTPEQPISPDEDVNVRLARASELTRLQNDIMQQAQQPSANALHSKHKNELVQQYKALEIEKMSVLSSIIKDGHDPMVTVFNAASKQNEEVRLSVFLNATNWREKPKTDPNVSLTESEGIRKVEKDGKTFFVIDGGKKTTQ